MNANQVTLHDNISPVERSGVIEGYRVMAGFFDDHPEGEPPIPGIGVTLYRNNTGCVHSIQSADIAEALALQLLLAAQYLRREQGRTHGVVR